VQYHAILSNNYPGAVILMIKQYFLQNHAILALHVTVLWILLNVCLAALDILNLDLVLCCWGCLCAIYCIVNNYCTGITMITFILNFCKFFVLVFSFKSELQHLKIELMKLGCTHTKSSSTVILMIISWNQ
jgi:hypothetical protein